MSIWDPDSLRVYVSHSIYDDPKTGVVRLKTPPLFEGIIYEPRSQAEIWELLPTLDSRIELFWIMAGRENFFITLNKTITKIPVWRRPENASNVIIDCGHLVSCVLPITHVDRL
jgi:hypothetical protein